MSPELTRNAFAVVVVVAVGAAVFRVTTAPERIQARKDTARSVCLGSGGELVKEDGEEVCRKRDTR